MKALLIIDVQNDFMPGGALAVPEADKIIPVINQLMSKFPLVIATQDWHPADHHSFSINHPGKSDFEEIILQGKTQTLWPSHCVQGSKGAEFHPELTTTPIAAIFRKGMDITIDSYSAFYDNSRQKSTGLAGYLREKQITELYFCGLCTDICVYYSILDAITLGFHCILLEEAACPLDRQRYQQLKKELIDQGVAVQSV